MTHVSDYLAVGNAFTNLRPPGVQTSPLYVYNVVPAAATSNALVADSTISGTGSSATITAGTGVSTTSINGVTVYDLGMARNVAVSGVGASTAEVSITVNGFEEIVRADNTRGPGMAMSQTFSGPSGTAATATTKTFRYIRSILVTGNTVSAIRIGTGDVFGMPYYFSDRGMVAIAWDGTQITSSAGLTVGVTSTATAATGDVRGTWSASSASNGIKRLVATVYVADPNSTSAWTPYGVPQA